MSVTVRFDPLRFVERHLAAREQFLPPLMIEGVLGFGLGKLQIEGHAGIITKAVHLTSSFFGKRSGPGREIAALRDFAPGVSSRLNRQTIQP